MVSIAIPTYEMGIYGTKFMEKSLEFISKQTYKNFEIVISDHSIDNKIQKLVESCESNFNIRYFKNADKIGNSSSNMNFALRKCEGKIVKILFQDEFLYDKDALKKIVDSFELNPDKKWLLNGCLFGEDITKIKGQMSPLYSEGIINGSNTVGSPSTLSILNESKLFFDENLVWMMDCDYYKKCYDSLGDPIIVGDPLIFVTQHEHQLTNILSAEKKFEETLYVINKYKK